MEDKLKFILPFTLHIEGNSFYVFNEGDVIMGVDREFFWETKFGRIQSIYVEVDMSNSIITKPLIRDDLNNITLQQLYDSLSTETDFFWLLYNDNYLKFNNRVFKSPLLTVMPEIESAINKTHLFNFICKFEESPVLIEIQDGVLIPVASFTVEPFAEEEEKKVVKLIGM